MSVNDYFDYEFDGDVESQADEIVHEAKDKLVDLIYGNAKSEIEEDRKNYARGILSYDFKNYKMPTLTKIILRTLFLDIILKANFISYKISCMPNYFTDKK